jgi:hypothetical protein
MNDKQIEQYVQIFFESTPYSERGEQIKNKIIESLKKESQNETFEHLIEKYNSLEKLCQLAGFTKEDTKLLNGKASLTTLSDFKESFKKRRRNVYRISIAFTFFFVFLYNLILERHWLFLILLGLCLFLFSYNVIKYQKDKTKETYSLESYQELKKLYDKYLKKTLNMMFFLIAFIVFYTVIIINIGINSKSAEVLETINSAIGYLETIIILFSKNLLLTNWLSQKIGKEKQKLFHKTLNKLTLTAVGYWFIYLASTFFWKNNRMNIFFLFVIAYGIAIFIYNLNGRKKITFQNLVVNKTRIALYGSIFILVFTYQFMQKDFWVLQPYINSVPNINTKHHPITYNDETGIFTITNQSSNDFKILQLTDIHLGGSVLSYGKDLKALKTVYHLIDYTKPDFIIVTGDLTFPLGILSFSFNNHTPVMQFASFMRNIGIPWAFTYGNHDTEDLATYSKEDLNTLYQSLSYKTSKNLLYPYTQPNITGRNNQLIEIRNQDGSLNQALFLIDSNAYTGEGLNKYDYIHDDQVAWYQKNILDLKQKEGKDISSMIFIHIPLQQYKTAYELYESGSQEVKYYFGSNDEKMFDKVCASDYPSKIFDTALELNSTKAFFCGHDHYNNMSLEYKGIRLTYGMSIDYLAMPGISNDTKQRGATLITLAKDSTFKIEQVPYHLIQ